MLCRPIFWLVSRARIGTLFPAEPLRCWWGPLRRWSEPLLVVEIHLNASASAERKDGVSIGG